LSELRYDPIRMRWTIIAEERKMRPHEFNIPSHSAAEDRVTCPLCPTADHSSEVELLVIPRPGPSGSGPDWQVRVVANRFPVLRVEGELRREGLGLFDRLTGVGAHEIIVENPDHDRELEDLSVREISSVFKAARARMLDLRRDVRLKYALLFKNKGPDAGASLSHPHCQLIATPAIPPFVVQELRTSRDHFARKERCIFCDVIRQEQRLDERVALESSRFIALAPYASAFPFETWILPKDHAHDFAHAADDDLDGLAAILRDVLRRMRVMLRDPPYNLVLHTAPSPHPRPGQTADWSTIEHDYHWHLELVPRITRIAGFEWGSGYTINPTPPEEAARFLREADPEEKAG